MFDFQWVFRNQCKYIWLETILHKHASRGRGIFQPSKMKMSQIGRWSSICPKWPTMPFLRTRIPHPAIKKRSWMHPRCTITLRQDRKVGNWSFFPNCTTFTPMQWEHAKMNPSLRSNRKAIRGAYDMSVFGICQLFGPYFSNLNKNGR